MSQLVPLQIGSNLKGVKQQISDFAYELLTDSRKGSFSVQCSSTNVVLL